MAIHWWLASGTYQKMESDVYALQGGSSWEQAVWTPIHVRGNEVPLTLSHLLPSFGILAVGLIPSAIAFIIELILYKKMTPNKVIGSVQTWILDSGSRQVPTLNDPKVVDLEGPGQVPEQRLGAVDELEDLENLVPEDPIPGVTASTKRSEVKETP